MKELEYSNTTESVLESEVPSVSIGTGAIDNTVATKKNSFKMWRRKKKDDKPIEE